MTTPLRRPVRQRRERSAGGVVFRHDGARLVVLLICDAHGNWGFPKGHMERGEAPAQTAVREVGEEAGITSLEVVAPAGTVEWTFRSRGARVRKRCEFFAMTTGQTRTRPQRTEGITACRWMTLAEARHSLTFENARHVLATAAEAMSGAGGPADVPRA